MYFRFTELFRRPNFRLNSSRGITHQLTALCLAFSVGMSATQAGELEDSSLALVPQDAALYTTNVNISDAWAEFIDGPFLERLRATSYIQKLEAELNQQWDAEAGQVKQAKAWLQNPNIKNLLKIAKEMWSDENFAYIGGDLNDSLAGLAKLQSEIMTVMGQGPDALENYFNELSPTDLDGIRVPTFVLGFRIEDDDNLRIQLDALEAIMRLGGSQFEQAKPFLQRLARKDLEDGQSLSISLAGSLIPLHQLSGNERQVAEKIVQLLGDRAIYFSMGVKSDVLLLTISEQPDVIATFGDAEKKLLDHPDLEPIRSGNTENLRSIAYISSEFSQSNWDASFTDYFERIATQFSVAMQSQAGRMPDMGEWIDDIQSDAKWMDSKLAELAPKFGSVLSWTRSTGNGLEGYSYNATTPSVFDNASPLRIINHAGKKPLAYVAVKQRTNAEAMEMVDFLLQNAPAHIKRFISLVEDGEEDKRLAMLAVDEGFPLLEDMIDVFKNKIGPSMANNETVFTFSLDWMVSELPELPSPKDELPLPEMAFACDVNDRDLFIEGGADLFGVFDRTLDLMRELAPDSAPPEYVIPRPKLDDTNGSTRFTYDELTSALPIEGFEPQALLTDEAIVFGLSGRQVRDMAVSQQAQGIPEWYEEDSSVAAVSYFDVAGIVEKLKPWVEYGLTIEGKALSDPLEEGPGPIPTGQDILDIWDCFSSAGHMSATTHVNDKGVTVTKWTWVCE